MSETLIARQPRKKTALPRHIISLEAYFAAEEKSLHKNEYHNGIVIKMAGALLSHNRLAQKAAKLIDNFIEDNDFNFIVSNSDTKIRIDYYDKVVYPDAVVICQEVAYFRNRKDTIINPILIVEVLSDSTKNYDKTTKFEMYRTLPSFIEYVLVHQDRKRVSVWTKQSDETWHLKDYTDDDSAILHHIENCPLSLERLYKNLDI